MGNSKLQLTRTIHDADGDSMALVVRAEELDNGTNFVTPDEFPLQLGLLSYSAGECAAAHKHPDRELGTVNHQEFIHVVSGTVDVDVFDTDDTAIETVTLQSGDTAFFVAGGRGWTAQEDATLVEAKLGPFLGDDDKIEL